MPERRNVLVTRRDERTIEVPIGSEMNALRNAATADSDWELATIQTVSSGDQRDPYTVGVRLTYRRKT